MTPEDKPAFLDPDRAASLDYVGADMIPVFDAEIPAPPAPAGLAGPEASAVPEPPLQVRERYRAVARYYSLGWTIMRIAEELGYTWQAVSRIIRLPWVQEQVAKYRASYDHDINNIVKDAALDGMRNIHKAILDPKTKPTVRADLSKWAVEKHSGKPAQQINHESGTFQAFFEMLKGGNPALREVSETDVPSLTQPAQAAPDVFDTWLDDHL